jgi:hypothetical protein
MSSKRPGIKEKYDAIVRLLEDEYALVHLDPAFPGVVLPAHLRGAPSVTLKLSRLFRGALTIGDVQIEADLLFGSTYVTCVVPYGAIWGISSAAGSNIVWPEDAPREVREKIVVSDGAEQPGVAESTAVPAEKSTAEKRRGHLRRVK